MDDVIDEQSLLSAAEDIYDGWYVNQRIDWDDFLYRLEHHADVDLGPDTESPLIRRIKRHINQYRKEG